VEDTRGLILEKLKVNKLLAIDRDPISKFLAQIWKRHILKNLNL